MMFVYAHNFGIVYKPRNHLNPKRFMEPTNPLALRSIAVAISSGVTCQRKTPNTCSKRFTPAPAPTACESLAGRTRHRHVRSRPYLSQNTPGGSEGDRRHISLRRIARRNRPVPELGDGASVTCVREPT